MVLTVLAFSLSDRLQAQCLTNTNFESASCPVVYSPDGCPTWSGACVGWTKSHGTPNLATSSVTTPKGGTITTTYVFMWGASTEGEGMFTPFTFQIHQTYDVRIVFASTCTTTGHVNVFAANGLTEHALTGCGNGYPGPSDQQIGRYTGNTGGVITDITFTFEANSNYSQLWIYPDGAGSEGPSEYMMSLFDVYACPSCTSLVTYNSGIVPTGTTAAGTIDVGSSAGTGGSGTVTNTPGAATVLAATQQVQLFQNFTASFTGGGSFVAEIVPCNSVNNVQSASAPVDSGVIVNPTQPESSKATTLSTGQALTLSAAAVKLQVYPTVSTGAINITGSAADLGNADIIVTDAAGRGVYRLHNGANTTLLLNLGNLSNGIYFLQIRNGTKITTQKIIISK